MTTHEHVLTRSVRDTAAILDAVGGPGVGDPYTAPAPTRPFRSEVGAIRGACASGFATAGTGDRWGNPTLTGGRPSTRRRAARGRWVITSRQRRSPRSTPPATATRSR